jgi:hypothetical protein
MYKNTLFLIENFTTKNNASQPVTVYHNNSNNSVQPSKSLLGKSDLSCVCPYLGNQACGGVCGVIDPLALLAATAQGLPRARQDLVHLVVHHQVVQVHVVQGRGYA